MSRFATVQARDAFLAGVPCITSGEQEGLIDPTFAKTNYDALVDAVGGFVGGLVLDQSRIKASVAAADRAAAASKPASKGKWKSLTDSEFGAIVGNDGIQALAALRKANADASTARKKLDSIARPKLTSHLEKSAGKSIPAGKSVAYKVWPDSVAITVSETTTASKAAGFDELF